LKPSHLPGGSTKAGGPDFKTAPIFGLVSNKNFIVANAIDTILSVPKNVEKGKKDYMQKEDYGKVPTYLNRIKADIQAEYDYINQVNHQYDDEAEYNSRFRPMDEGEKLGLINALKERWEAQNTEYQAHTHITMLDSLGQRKRKEKQEATLSQIEKDIERLNKRNIAIDMMA